MLLVILEKELFKGYYSFRSNVTIQYK